jgi:hypothetical protein
MALVIALPAGAGKPNKPPKPPTSAPIAVYLDADPIWVHEAGDVIWYSVTIQNKTTAAVVVGIEFPDGQVVDKTIDPSSVLAIDGRFSHEANADDIATPVDIVGTVTVSYPGGEVVASTSTDVYPEDDCKFVENQAQLTGGEVCIWKPPSSGEWTVLVTPEEPMTRPTRMMVSVRDGVPGNWCTDSDVVDSGVVFRRLMPEDSVFKLHVFLPGSGDEALKNLADGQCNSGGAGGDYFAVGNPESFYLYTSFSGTATVTHTPDS